MTRKVRKDESERYDLRLEMKVKNNVLWHAIYDNYGSVSALCRAYPKALLSRSGIGLLLRFKASPFTKDGSYRPLCLKLERVLKIPAEDLFPQSLYAQIQESEKAVEVSSFAALPGAVRREIAMLPAPAVTGEDVVMRSELHDQLVSALRFVTPRELEVLKRRFCFDVRLGGLRFTDRVPGEMVPLTYAEVARQMGVALERVRQLERRGLWRLFGSRGQSNPLLSYLGVTPEGFYDRIYRGQTQSTICEVFLNLLEACARPP